MPDAVESVSSRLAQLPLLPGPALRNPPQNQIARLGVRDGESIERVLVSPFRDAASSPWRL
jgi:hypothetical protein